ncbi:hypothetical protein DNHGIG_40350 [Collibacillus ludicampi]|jgi:hypothetical protein|uniref:Uncharacterized protein n=1 Tax=Collibacillus ludicampi TaxID=2771369 RepID=A0AAV4LL26_9BACL|nr:hypothetical protein DNHGIG_40350 [Collibacillus ludicampi]
MRLITKIEVTAWVDIVKMNVNKDEVDHQRHTEINACMYTEKLTELY